MSWLRLVLVVLMVGTAVAEPRVVQTADELSSALLDSAHVVVEPGVYRGHFVIDRPLVLEGRGRPVLDGSGQGTVLIVNAPDVTVRGFELRGSGCEPEQDHAGIILNGARPKVEDNRFRDVLFGIVVSRCDGARLVGNDIQGKTAFDQGRKGDAIRIWYSQGVSVEGNRIQGCRDLVAWYSSDLVFRHNQVLQGRYGVHFMYSDRSLVEDNQLEDNSVGIYTMYSRQVTMRRNRIFRCRGASGYALGFKDAEGVSARDNQLVDNRVAFFLDGADCQAEHNVIAYNDVGVALFPSVRGAAFTANSFYENAEQVRIEGSGRQTGNRFEGNFWSDYTGCDLDGDGRGDQPYRSEKLFENLADRDPTLRLFSGTLAQLALDGSARTFPVFLPEPKIEDPRPRTAPPVLPSPDSAPQPALLGLLWPLLALAGLSGPLLAKRGFRK